MPIHTLLDAQRLRNSDREVGLIQENLAAAPELETFLVRQINGVSYKTSVVSGQSAGGFRAANSGVAIAKATIEQRLTECFLYEAPIELDAGVQQASLGDTVADLEMLEASQVMLGTMQRIGRQIFYGTANDALGFSGIKQFVPKTAVAGSGSIFVDATGAAAGTASSVYGVKFGLKDCHLVLGNGSAFTMSDFMDQQLTDANGRKYMGRVASLRAWVGLQIGNVNCVGRIGNLTAESGKTLTDALLARLVGAFPVAYKPDALFMSRRSASQLAASRPRTSYFGPGQVRAGQNVAVTDYTVADYQGIPVIVTDQILDTDTIE